MIFAGNRVPRGLFDPLNQLGVRPHGLIFNRIPVEERLGHELSDETIQYLNSWLFRNAIDKGYYEMELFPKPAAMEKATEELVESSTRLEYTTLLAVLRVADASSKVREKDILDTADDYSSAIQESFNRDEARAMLETLIPALSPSAKCTRPQNRVTWSHLSLENPLYSS